MKTIIEVKYKDHTKVELTNSIGDTFTSTSEPLIDFFNDAKPFKFDLPAVSHLLIAWEQYKKSNWWESDAIDVEKVLMKQFEAIYCG